MTKRGYLQLGTGDRPSDISKEKFRQFLSLPFAHKLLDFPTIVVAISFPSTLTKPSA